MEKTKVSDAEEIQGYSEIKTHLVVLVLSSDGRKVNDLLDTGLLEDVLCSDSTPLEDGRSSERSTRDDDHLPRLHRHHFSDGRGLLGVVRSGREGVVAVLDSDRAGRRRLVEEDTDGLLLSEEVEVRLCTQWVVSCDSRSGRGVRRTGVEDGVDESVGGILATSGGGRDPLGPVGHYRRCER